MDAAPAPGRDRRAPSRATGIGRVSTVLRLAVAAAILAALTWSGLIALEDGEIARFLSYFTNQSAAAYAVLMLLGAGTAWRLRWWDDLRGAVAFAMVMTGIVYAALVAPPGELGRWDIGWTGIVLHRLAPLAALLDWVLTPVRSTPTWRRPLRWLVYPVVFLVLTWIRGAVTGWYPYTFLDPGVGGWDRVAVTTLGVLLAFLLVALVLHLVGGRRRVDGGHRTG